MENQVENHVRNNCTWNKLPKNVKQLLGNSQKEYEKIVVEYSVKNQLRFKGNLIRYVRKNEEQYYDLLMQHSRSHLMLYPYHLSDIVVRELRTTPFQYYLGMMQDLMSQERSYDSLPNFTAADCLRLLGIGRNQYIELMNQCRASKKVFRRRPLKEILPQKPVEIPIDPWWMVEVGNVMEEDIRGCSKGDKDIVDMLIDEGAQLAGTLDASVIQNLYYKGLVYLDVPIQDDDFIIVPPLDGFVMNRVLGDYFETLLYKIFVSIDEHTTVSELGNILSIDLTLVKNAVSVFCRLGFAKKKITGLENMALHVTWAKHMQINMDDAIRTLDISLVTPETESGHGFPGEEDDIVEAEEANDLLPASDGTPVEGKRLGFLFDSTLTAFLMMGNLSNSLKSHAVTLFEVGKLSDEALGNFVEELQKVELFGEGEAERYFEHADVLKETIQSLRDGHEMDLLRCESLMGLDVQSRLRILRKNYMAVMSMAPLTNEVSPVNCCSPPHFGPPIAEVNSPWFRLFLYQLLGKGPVSVLVTKGTRLQCLPRPLRQSRRLLLCTWSHDPGLVASDTCLPALNEALQHSAVFLQAYTNVPSDTEVVHIPFPSDRKKESEEGASGSLLCHPSVVELENSLGLSCSCGYVTLLHSGCEREEDELCPEDSDSASSSVGEPPLSLNLSHHYNTASSSSRDPRKVPSFQAALDRKEIFKEWEVFDCVFGLPLFDRELNRRICTNISDNHLFDVPQRDKLREMNRKLSLQLLDFIQKFQPVFEEEGSVKEHKVPYPVHSLVFQKGEVTVWDGR